MSRPGRRSMPTDAADAAVQRIHRVENSPDRWTLDRATRASWIADAAEAAATLPADRIVAMAPKVSGGDAWPAVLAGAATAAAADPDAARAALDRVPIGDLLAMASGARIVDATERVLGWSRSVAPDRDARVISGTAMTDQGGASCMIVAHDVIAAAADAARGDASRAARLFAVLSPALRPPATRACTATPELAEVVGGVVVAAMAADPDWWPSIRMEESTDTLLAIAARLRHRPLVVDWCLDNLSSPTRSKRRMSAATLATLGGASPATARSIVVAWQPDGVAGFVRRAKGRGGRWFDAIVTGSGRPRGAIVAKLTASLVADGTKTHDDDILRALAFLASVADA